MMWLLAAMVGGCTGREEASDRPVIVASIYPLANVIEQIVGDRAEVVCVVPPGISPHGFEPTARHMEAIRRAEIIVMVGLNYDAWAEEARERYGRSDAELLVFAELVGRGQPDDTVTTHAHGSYGEHEHGHGHNHDHDHTHDHDHAHDGSAVNPHLWMDPVLTHRFVEALGVELADRLGDADGQLASRAAALAEELAELDRDYAEALAPYVGAKIITFHNAFDLLIERYGLKMAATLSPIEAPGAMTSGRVERALRVIHEHSVRTVYAEPQFPPDAGRVLQQEAGVRVLMLDPLGDPHDPTRDSYQKLMRENLNSLVEGVGYSP